ncbi:SusC/RagA family TonB-linked outer membrane protein [Bizionia arctica]|uniref:SusC/RagA family TonB-linked outer membrane protein n=1 Tax=Bizionia arctica TaxID=1495645 RepID=A0A917LM25_9FLAO|nr:SusC/RagA family TonB-linked outer membrane protein [Bizionia arctica]GGG42048.1 SusC/RagA family TonB-linked outer membrane protein [Bizionia arctica]
MKTKFSGILTLFLAFVVQFTFAQEKTISGTVSDENGLPLPGVNIIVKGTTNGTQTDFDGNYSISASAGDVLSYSFVGYTNKDMTVGSASNMISFSMIPDVTAIDEVVVTALGIKKEERSIGYSSQNLKSNDLNEIPVTNVVDALTGKIAGVNITKSSGDVGASTRIVIRGISTIYGSAQPLIVVDGVVMNNSSFAETNTGTDLPNGLADINPEDIADLNVLKGGAATSLYGMRGTNGVIVITTKTGTKKESLGISINSNVSFSNPYIFPDYQNSYGQGHSSSYFEYIDGFGYDGGAVSGDGGTDESWGPALDAGYNFIQYQSLIDNPNNPQPLPWVSNPDSVVDDFYNTGLTTTNTVALNGSSDKATYRLSMGLTDAEGIIYNTDLKKYNFSGNVNFDLSDKWSAGITAMYIKSTSENRNATGYGDVDNQIGQLVWGARQVDWGALRDWQSLPLIETNNPGIYTPLNWNLSFNNNPFWALDNNLHPWERNRWVGSVNLGYEITDKLTVSASTGIDYFDDSRETQRAFGTVDFRNGFYQTVSRNNYEVNSQAILAYNTKLGSSEDFGLSLSVGGNIMRTKYNLMAGTAEQLVLNGLYNLSNSASAPIIQEFHSEEAINSLFGTGQLSYKNFVYLDFSGRNDWASVLPLDNNSFFYPAVSLSLVASDMLNLDKEVVSFLKVRGAWAITGSAGPLAPYNVAPSYNLSSSPLNGTDPTALISTTLWNENIKPQNETEFEVGLDARFFSNRLRLDFSYYNKEATDVILPVDVSAASGFISVWDNAATITNKGIELVLGADIIRSTESDGFNLGVNVNFGKNDNMVSDIAGDAVNLQNGDLWNVNTQARNGYPIGVIYGPAFARSDSGEIIYDNGLPVVSSQYEVLGNSQADWTGGVGINMSYKGFSFSSLIDTKVGGEVYSQTNTWGMLSGVLAETLPGRETGVIGNGVMSDGNGGYVPNNVIQTAQSYYSTAFSQNVAESSVFDATFVKWRELAIGYTIPSKHFNNMPIQSIAFGLNVRNLALLYSAAPNIDPETAFGTGTGQQGLEYAQTPSARTIGFSVNVKF